ncbi:MAG: HIT family protein [Actinomycetota bacterium]
MSQECEGCRLTSGASPLPGGRIFQTEHWVVEHCVGTLGIGTLILKPFRHTVRLSDLSVDEAAELGPLITHMTSLVEELTAADQVYVCLWSHAGWEPGHVHFVVQPSWNHLKDRFPGPGPSVQMAMFKEAEPLDIGAVEDFCDKARAALAPSRAFPATAG